MTASDTCSSLPNTELLPAARPLLLAWFAQNHREMPWRRDPTPYHVWISEIMLQQTRISAVIPYYERFIAAYPMVQALAAAEDEKLMKLWEGLGYYSRARNLKKAAIQICENHGGVLPDSAEQLAKLPGIGAYTAGAIASIAFGKPAPAVDGNVLRVIMRLLGCEWDIMAESTKKEVRRALASVYPVGKEAGLFTESLMELGENLCIPSEEPRCDACPLGSLCIAHREACCDRLPVKTPKKPPRAEARTVLLLYRADVERFALCRRPPHGLLGGLWEFPNTEGHLTESEARAFAQSLGLTVQTVIPLAPAFHAFSHVEWHMRGYWLFCAPTAAVDPRLCWGTPQEIAATYALPGAFRAYTKYTQRTPPSVGSGHFS